MKLISILLFLALGACAHKPVPHTYLKYSGYMDGCADTTIYTILANNPDFNEENINYTVLDAMCMDLYLMKLEEEDIKPPMIRIKGDEIL